MAFQILETPDDPPRHLVDEETWLGITQKVRDNSATLAYNEKLGAEGFPDLPAGLPGLEELGYSVDEKDKIIYHHDPPKGYHYNSNKNERYVQTRHEDYEDACRRLVEWRLYHLQLSRFFMPAPSEAISVTTHPTNKPHIPIFASGWINSDVNCQNLVLFVGKGNEAPHIHSRHIWDSDGVNAGSIVNFVRDFQKSGPHGLIVANPGQRFWSTSQKRAVTLNTFDALQRDKALDMSFQMSKKNYVYENGTALEHLECLFQTFILPKFKADNKHPKLHVICIDDTVVDLLKVVQSHWDALKEHLSSIVACNGFIIPEEHFLTEDFRRFWARRGKGYWLSDSPIDTPLEMPTGVVNYFSSGEDSHAENIFSRVYPKILEYHAILYGNPDYEVDYPDPRPQDGEGLEGTKHPWETHNIGGWET